jgi:outer membrane protein TolC
MSLNAGFTVIDEERAENSFGQQAQRTSSGSARLEQVLFSESLNSNIDIGKSALAARRESFQTSVLDTIYETVEAYFSILKAKTRAKIQKKDLDLTRKHLAIAWQRQRAGYSGMSDVYRWQSSIATSTSSLFEAKNAYKLSKISLNQLMGRPLNGDISVREESLDGDLFQTYTNISEYDYIDNPSKFDKFVNFLVSLAVLNSPELKEIKAEMEALERQRLHYARQRYVPTATVTGDATHVFNRDGKGSEVEGISVEDNQWSVALNLSWPIFSGGSSRVNQIKTEKEIVKLKNRMNHVAQTLEQNVRSAALNVINKYINLESTKKSASYSEKSLNLVQESYSKGRVSITELINAQSESLNTKLGALTSAYDFLLSVFNLERATGWYKLFATPAENRNYTNKLKTHMEISPK